MFLKPIHWLIRYFIFFGLWTQLSCTAQASSFSQIQGEYYLKQLKQADAWVTKKNKRLNSSQALSVSLHRRLALRHYQKGDAWESAAWRIGNHSSSPAISSTNSPAHSELDLLTQGGIFHYEVIEVSDSPHSTVAIKISQKVQNGFPRIDPQVSWIQLRLDENLALVEKAYFFQNGSSRVIASTHGVHTQISPLELYPLDFPSLHESEEFNPSHDSLYEQAIKKLPLPTRMSLQLSDAFGLRLDDLFGRPIEIYWKPSSLWPNFIHTPNGVALLIEEKR